MLPWALLALTLASALMTFHVFNLFSYFSKHQKMFYIWVFGNRGEYLHDRADRDNREFLVGYIERKVGAFFIVLSLALGGATVKAFTA